MGSCGRKSWVSRGVSDGVDGGDGREGHGEETAACAGEGVGYVVAFGGDGGGLGHCLFVGGWDGE